jgi:hypothetical protein
MGKKMAESEWIKVLAKIQKSVKIYNNMNIDIVNNSESLKSALKKNSDDFKYHNLNVFVFVGFSVILFDNLTIRYFNR